MPEFRLCKKCNREKFLFEFAVHTKATGGRRHECNTCHAARMNMHYLENLEYRKRRQKERYSAKPSRVWSDEEKQVAYARAKKYRVEYLQIILDHYGPKCVCCGEETREFLTIDHINNDGAKMRQIHGTGLRLHRWIIKKQFPDTFQILCYNCNCGRARNGGICPHQITEGSTIIPQGSRAKRPEALSSRHRLMI